MKAIRKFLKSIGKAVKELEKLAKWKWLTRK